MGRIEGLQASRLCSFRFAGGTPASQDRGHLACKRLYSTANERVYIRLVFQQLAFATGSRASRLQAVVLNRW
ncbi:MAG: hypothetical protein LBP59_14030 [Planctomycetaceae bacterium]|nr:hypothetical protein [Planctomycetaceae bacterium]